MRIIIQKFGGTSVSSTELRAEVTARVREAVSSGFSSVVVVSAMGRAGDPYATDTLIRLARQENPDSAARDLDLIMSCGEVISAVLVVNALRAQGIDALALTGGQAGIITNQAFSNADIIAVEPDHVVRHLEEGKVVVVCGFQGMTEAGDVTTLGRGGSDTTAAALGAALGAEVVEIYTDVDGVMTADPRIVPEARTLELIGHFEVCQMANEGAKVVHPRAVEIAMQSNVPLRVRATRGGGPGTLIATGRRMGWPQVSETRPVAAVTHLPGLTQIRAFPAGAGSFDAQSEIRVFDDLARAGISVDLINVSPDLISFTVSDETGARAESILGEQGLRAERRAGCAKVSVVGLGMRGVPGVMARVTRALGSEDIRILQTSDSHATISCLVRAEDMERSIVALHREFQLAQATPGQERWSDGGTRHVDHGDGDSVPSRP